MGEKVNIEIICFVRLNSLRIYFSLYEAVKAFIIHVVNLLEFILLCQSKAFR